MTTKYSQKEVNQILLSKKLNDFYFAIIENRQELLTDEEYQEITTREHIIYGKNEEEVKELFRTVATDEHLKNFTPEIMKVMFSLAQIRHIAILTMIDDDIYDIGNAEFVNLKRNKIIHYDNLTNYYDDTNARIRLFTSVEEPQLKEDTVLVDVDDESMVQNYEHAHVYQEASEDLTRNFFHEVKGKPYTLKR